MASQTQDRGAVMITGASTGIGKACAMRLEGGLEPQVL